MSLEIKRSHVSALAKAMANPDISKLSHLQRVDLIAKTLGFDNQAALMGTLKSQEKSAPAEAGVRTEIAMVFGSEYTSAFSNLEPVGEFACCRTRLSCGACGR